MAYSNMMMPIYLYQSNLTELDFLSHCSLHDLGLVQIPSYLHFVKTRLEIQRYYICKKICCRRKLSADSTSSSVSSG